MPLQIKDKISTLLDLHVFNYTSIHFEIIFENNINSENSLKLNFHLEHEMITVSSRI